MLQDTRRPHRTAKRKDAKTIRGGKNVSSTITGQCGEKREKSQRRVRKGSQHRGEILKKRTVDSGMECSRAWYPEGIFEDRGGQHGGKKPETWDEENSGEKN